MTLRVTMKFNCSGNTMCAITIRRLFECISLHNCFLRISPRSSEQYRCSVTQLSSSLCILSCFIRIYSQTCESFQIDLERKLWSRGWSFCVVHNTFRVCPNVSVLYFMVLRGYLKTNMLLFESNKRDSLEK